MFAPDYHKTEEGGKQNQNRQESCAVLRKLVKVKKKENNYHDPLSEHHSKNGH